MTKRLPELTITHSRKSAILQFLAIVGYWRKKLYASKGLPYKTDTDNRAVLNGVEIANTMEYADGVLTLSVKLECGAYARPTLSHAAGIDTGFGTEKLTIGQLQKYITRQKSLEKTLFDGQ